MCGVGCASGPQFRRNYFFFVLLFFCFFFWLFYYKRKRMKEDLAVCCCLSFKLDRVYSHIVTSSRVRRRRRSYCYCWPLRIALLPSDLHKSSCFWIPPTLSSPSRPHVLLDVAMTSFPELPPPPLFF